MHRSLVNVDVVRAWWPVACCTFASTPFPGVQNTSATEVVYTLDAQHHYLSVTCL